MSLLRVGQIIRDTYEVERYLGEGAFAEVYRVKHRFLGRQAIKVFKASGMTIPEIERMLEEAILLSRIGHPNIIRVFDANVTETAGGICGFFTMEYVAGGSLEQFWRSYGHSMMPVDTAVELIRQVCQGLAVAHGEDPPIIHRDIKPQNILVGYDPAGLRARVSDFGLAKRVNPLTLMASARGTPCFKAPEVFRDFSADSCAGDVWALGATLYLLLTDRLPYTGLEDGDEIDSSVFERPLISPRNVNLDVDPVLDRIISKALALDPGDRYQTAGELLERLKNWRPLLDGAHEKLESGHQDTSKTALGARPPFDVEGARKMALRAVELARNPGSLVEAADLMEEVINQYPALRDEFEYRVRLWRRGVSM